DKPGIYRGQCSQICGKEHGFMPIVVLAKTPEEYAAWVKQEKAKTPPPTPQAVPQQAAAETAAAAPAQAAEAQAVGAGAAAGGEKVAAAPADANKKYSLDELKAKGEPVYAANCAACHQATGKGMPP